MKTHLQDAEDIKAKPRETACNVSKENNRLRKEDLFVHDWYRFVLSFPPHLVREYIERFRLDSSKTVLDPFCGTGTTLVECKKRGIPSIGIERNPMACFASQVKVDWTIDSEELLSHARSIARLAVDRLKLEGIDTAQDLPLFRNSEKSAVKLRTLLPEADQLIQKNAMSPLPLHKTLVLLETLDECREDRFAKHERLALAKAIAYGVSNLKFGPEVGLGQIKRDAPVVDIWLDCVRKMAEDLRHADRSGIETAVYCADARSVSKILNAKSIDAVITSPPYPNEKDYTRTTRLESVLLGLIRNKEDLRAVKQELVRSNTRGVYKHDEDDRWVSPYDEIRAIADAVEERRLRLGKTSGFERLYARVTKLYFGGMAKHLFELRTVLRPGAQLAYVVGDQASYLQVMIRTGHLLMQIARSLGYEVVGVDLFRTRFATATKERLREEVILLKWPGEPRKRAAD